MTTFHTGNPIGSTAAKDLFDNAENLDTAVNSQTADTWIDRLGKSRNTWLGIEKRAQIDIEAAAEFATAQAEGYRDEAREARDDAVAAASAIGPIKFYGTYAQAIGDIENIPDDGLIEIARDETHSGARTRYFKRATGVMEFAVNIDQLRIDLKEPSGAARVSFRQNGDGAVTRNVLEKLQDFVSVADFMSTQDFSDISSGTRSIGVRDAVEKAIRHVNAIGGLLHFPPGHYNAPYLDHTDARNWIEITGSGVSLVATPGSVTLENFLIYVHGEYGAPQIVGSAGFTTGDNQINTSAVHGLAADDYVQLLSGMNAYTPDGGDWQLGSQNPTYLTTPNCRYSEIHRVFSVDSSTTATLYDSVIYAGYRDNIVGMSDPMPGIVGAEIRKLRPVVGVIFDGITFKNVEYNSFRCILVRCAADVAFRRCHFEARGLPGVHVRTTDTINIRFIDCSSYRKPIGAGGSSWNSFVLGGGSQGMMFRDCKFIGEQQTIDITPNLFPLDIGYTGEVIRAEYITAQGVSVIGCDFVDCSDGVTTHPGTYNFSASSNNFEGCATGIRARSRKNTITGNVFRTFRAGVTFSAFYDNTLISSNNFEQLPKSTSVEWIGVNFSPLSSEIMNNNNVKNVVVINNTLRVVQANPGNLGIRFRHGGNGVPPNPEFTQFNDTIKTNLSFYQIVQNNFIGCSSRIGRWINGVSLWGNKFSGGSDLSHYIRGDTNSARHTINLNFFKDDLAAALFVSPANSPAFPYSVSHRIGYQFGESGPLTVDANNSRGMFVYGNELHYLNILRFADGGRLESVRSIGESRLDIDAVVNDGTSNARVRMFLDNPTTGNKTLEVYGRITSENIYPRIDNAYSSGIASRRLSVVYAASSAINTCDAREKSDPLPIDDCVLDAWGDVQIVVFQWLEAIEKKGESLARWHTGVIAQQVRDAFIARGLDGTRYGLLCYDQWPDEYEESDDGTLRLVETGGTRWGIRADQCLFLEAAYQRREMQRQRLETQLLKDRIAAIEGKVM